MSVARRFGMLLAIQLNKQFQRYTGKIGDIRPNGVLPTDSHAELPAAQPTPYALFRVGHIAA